MRVVLEGVVAGYGFGDVLRGLDLVAEEGEITCLIGPNGAGKSTVLRAVSGLLQPRRGSIKVGDHEIAGVSPRAMLELGVVHGPQARDGPDVQVPMAGEIDGQQHDDREHAQDGAEGNHDAEDTRDDKAKRVVALNSKEAGAQKDTQRKCPTGQDHHPRDARHHGADELRNFRISPGSMFHDAGRNGEY